MMRNLVELFSASWMPVAMTFRPWTLAARALEMAAAPPDGKSSSEPFATIEAA